MKTKSSIQFCMILSLGIFLIGSTHLNAQSTFMNPFTGNLEAGSVKGTFCMPGMEVWGGSVVKHDDGMYYMLASAWPANEGHWVWATSSRILVAVSKSPEGPYTFVNTVTPFRDKRYWDGGSTFNPVIKKHKNTYYLFYTGTTYDFERPEKDPMGLRDERFSIAWDNKRIGVATANHPMGPWKRFEKPIIEPREGHWDKVLTSNAAPVIHDDGSVTLFYKSSNIPHAERQEVDKIDDLPRFIIGVAKADSVFGEYKRLGDDDGMINIEGQFVSLEDPFAWHDGTNYHMVVKNFNTEFSDEEGGAIYLRSSDGVTFRLPEDAAQVYSKIVFWEEGIKTVQKRLEKPSILMENGKPAWMFNATMFDSKEKMHCNCESCVYNVTFRIKDPARF